MGRQQRYNGCIRCRNQKARKQVLRIGDSPRQSQLGSTRAAVPPGVFVHELHHPSVKEQSQQATDTEAPTTVREVLMIEKDWRTQFIDFIKEFKVPPHVDHKSAEAACIIRRSKGFVLISDNLYKHSASGILMKCVTLEEGKDIL